MPALALAAYQRAATVIGLADSSCHLAWPLLAAIGRVESDHGRSGGSQLDREGKVRPRLLGPPLDGRSGAARIVDTDGGAMDGDTVVDRALGPMQFIPSTWAVIAVDGDGDGRRDPQDIDDAALAAGVFLCAWHDDLATEPGQRAALLRYNHSPAYARLVLATMARYAAGYESATTTLPLAAVETNPGTTPGATPGAHPAAPGEAPADPGHAGEPVIGTWGVSHHPVWSPSPLPAPAPPTPRGPIPSATPSAAPSATPSVTASTTPSAAPSDQPSPEPTDSSTSSPSAPGPSEEPSSSVDPDPTSSPSVATAIQPSDAETAGTRESLPDEPEIGNPSQQAVATSCTAGSTTASDKTLLTCVAGELQVPADDPRVQLTLAELSTLPPQRRRAPGTP